MIKQRRGVFIAILIILGLSVWKFYDPLAAKELKTYSFYDRNDKLICILSADGGRVRTWVALDEINPETQRVFIELEDKRFYKHFGLDFLAIGRASLDNIKYRKFVSGASTITQQLAKNILDVKKRTIPNKIIEAFLAIYLEIRYSKAEILENYFNRIYYGNLIGGINTAAEFYFKKAPRNLNLKESVVLALLAKSPVSNPLRLYNDSLGKEINDRLNYLADLKIITRETQEYYKKIPLSTNSSLNEDLLAPNFLNFVLQEERRAGHKRTKIQTTLDYELQVYIVNVLQEEFRRLREKNINNAAVIVIENKSGEILAYVGSADFSDVKHGGQIDGVQSYRQPGSAIKPFMYYLALENGFSPATILPDIKMSFKAGNGVYNPRNYDDQYRGPVTLRNALGNSLNIPAVYLLSKMDSGKFLVLLQRLGFDNLKRNPDHYGLGLVLGNGEVSLYELSKAYVCLANAGVYFKKLLYAKDAKLESLSLLASDKVFLITDILNDNSARELAFGRNNNLNFRFPAASKTGTTKEFRDNWAISYTTEITVGVWVGNHDQSIMHNSSGITGAGPILRKIILKANEKYPAAEFIRPAAIVSSNICLESGLLVGRNCSKTKQELFTPDNLPREICAEHQIVREQNMFIYPVIYKAWLEENFPEQEYQIRGNTETKQAKLIILYPPDNTYYAVDPVINKQDQKITFKINNDLETKWYVNNKFIGISSLDKNAFWQLERGSYMIEAIQGKQKAISKINVY